MNTRYLSTLYVLVMLFLAISPLRAQSLELHWAVGAHHAPDMPWGTTFNDLFDFGDIPMQRGRLRWLAEHQAGLFPKAGPHVVQLDPTYMERHLYALHITLTWAIPDRNYDGYAVLDYESWMPSWKYTWNAPSDQAVDAPDQDFKDDWRDYIRQHKPDLLVGRTPQQQEQIFINTYEQAARKFFLDTLMECKRLRPKAKWGYYSLPYRRHGEWNNGQSEALQAENDKLQAIFDASGAIFPSIYMLYYGVEDTRPWSEMNRGETRQIGNLNYVLGNVNEAVRVARGKPVLPWVLMQYHEATGPVYTRTPLNHYDLSSSLITSNQPGVTGLVFFGTIPSYEAFYQQQFFFLDKVVPTLHITLEHNSVNDYYDFVCGDDNRADTTDLLRFLDLWFDTASSSGPSFSDLLLFLEAWYAGC